MDIVCAKQDEAIYNMTKVYLAQIESAMKISKILCEHSDEKELSGDHIICGLIYRLMVPMTDGEMVDSLNNAEHLLNDTDSDEESDEEGYESDEEDFNIEISDKKRPLKINNCNCDICIKCRECVSGYESYETYDPMVTRFKDSIKITCDKYNIYIN
tara:strand:- start:112 stop:582 length:471 start_codon:yes stop_codon:yes gene_type:complete